MVADLDEPAAPMGSGGFVRLRLDLSYDGTDFSGWALQPDRRTVQGVLQSALATLFRLESASVVVAGRTDAGVHAIGQVAHFDVSGPSWDEHAERGLRRLNGLLPADVRVQSLGPAAAGFDARFSAIWRKYRYLICDASYGVSPLDRRDTVGWRRSLDVPSMHSAAQRLLGLNDFVAFCKRRDGATAIRTLQRLDVVRRGAAGTASGAASAESVIEFLVQADAFCHSMVRSLVGALTAVGEGLRDSDWLARQLSATVRSDHVTVAPAHGLTLIQVGYPPDASLAARALLTRDRRAR
jgi:tRNA pseudouridine38-40 synthase